MLVYIIRKIEKFGIVSAIRGTGTLSVVPIYVHICICTYLYRTYIISINTHNTRSEG